MIFRSEISVRAVYKTVVFWLQNEAGFEEWKPTDQKVESLLDSYRPGRERERDRQDLLSPERQNPHQADKAVAAAAAAAAASTTVGSLLPSSQTCVIPTNSTNLE